jgi:AcrR family transcriptional regulator
MASSHLTRLPRGRHKLPRQHVLDSQRERLVRAILECVAERGYAETTISDVVTKARVSRNAFYEFFDDKPGCYLEACDAESTSMLDELYSFATEKNWTDAVRKGTSAYLRWWQRNPEYAVAYLVELPAAGRRALEQRDRTYARFEAMFEALAARARAEQPKLPPLPALAARVLVASITEIVGQEVRAGRVAVLHELEDELAFLIVKTLADDRTAERAIRSSASRARAASSR